MNADRTPKKKSVNYNATLLKRIDITPQLLIFQVRPDQESLTFSGGQFTVLGLKRSAPRIPEADPEEVDPEKAERLVRRAYSISSGSQTQDYIEFYISLVTSGELTPRLFHLQAGDRLFMGESAKGMFTLDNIPTGKNILLIGTGTGLAPYISMVRSLTLGINSPTYPITILHGAKYSWDLGYRGELEALAQTCQHFRYYPCITQPDQDTSWKGHTGRLNEWVTKPELESLCGFSLNPKETHVFLCGHPNMVEESSLLLEKRGFEQGNRKEPGTLHLEKYW